MVLSSYNGEMENSDKKAMETEFHVRYAETDAMGVVPVSYTHLTLPTILRV